MEKELRKKAAERMQAAADALKREFGSVRTGRASLALLDAVTVDYYGTPTPLKQLASMSTPDSRSILIQPWDPKAIPLVEKAVLKSDLGLTPVNDGKSIRINIPPLTEERRLQLVRVVKKKAEESRVEVRNIRRNINEELKKSGHEKKISEDDLKKALDEIQKTTDSFIKKIDEILANKEKEIMEV